MQRLRKKAKLSQTDLAELMTERGRPWHQNTVSRIELGKQELDSIGDLNALQGLLGAGILDGTALAMGREADTWERVQIVEEATREIENIKAGLEKLEQASDRLLSAIGVLEPRPRVSTFTPDDAVKIVTDLDPRSDPAQVMEELKRAFRASLDDSDRQARNGVD